MFILQVAKKQGLVMGLYPHCQRLHQQVKADAVIGKTFARKIRKHRAKLAKAGKLSKTYGLRSLKRPPGRMAAKLPGRE